jgi:hypothetical protein
LPLFERGPPLGQSLIESRSLVPILMAPAALVTTFAELFLLLACTGLAVTVVAVFPDSRRPYQDHFALFISYPRTTHLIR